MCRRDWGIGAAWTGHAAITGLNGGHSRWRLALASAEQAVAAVVWWCLMRISC